MDIQRAKELLTALADGLDPLTGEVLPSDHVCNKGDIVRALHCVLEALPRGLKKPLPTNHGKPWTEKADRFPFGAVGENSEKIAAIKCRPTGDQTLLRMRYDNSVIKRRRVFP